MNKVFLVVSASVAALIAASSANAANVAIVAGDYYSPNLKNALVAKGHTVTEIASYTAASLAPFNAVVMYGNTFTDQDALSAYATGGGRVILTPWAGLNFAVQSDMQVFDNGGSAEFSILNPSVNVLAAANPLLAGVNFPAGGLLDIGRIGGINFVAGATQVASWGDGTAFIGTVGLGLGTVIGINLQAITSDTAFVAVDEPWATQLFSNAVGGGTGTVPEPQSWAMLIAGFGLVGAIARRRRSGSPIAA